MGSGMESTHEDTFDNNDTTLESASAFGKVPPCSLRARIKRDMSRSIGANCFSSQDRWLHPPVVFCGVQGEDLTSEARNFESADPARLNCIQRIGFARSTLDKRNRRPLNGISAWLEAAAVSPNEQAARRFRLALLSERERQVSRAGCSS